VDEGTEGRRTIYVGGYKFIIQMNNFLWTFKNYLDSYLYWKKNLALRSTVVISAIFFFFSL
jgi:hypothetical protein